MKELNFEQMAQVEGGCLGKVAGMAFIGGFVAGLGPVGLIGGAAAGAIMCFME